MVRGKHTPDWSASFQHAAGLLGREWSLQCHQLKSLSHIAIFLLNIELWLSEEELGWLVGVFVAVCVGQQYYQLLPLLKLPCSYLRGLLDSTILFLRIPVEQCNSNYLHFASWLFSIVQSGQDHKWSQFVAHWTKWSMTIEIKWKWRLVLIAKVVLQL